MPAGTWPKRMPRSGGADAKNALSSDPIELFFTRMGARPLPGCVWRAGVLHSPYLVTIDY